MECIPDGKPPALPEDEFKKQQALAMEQESLECQLRNEEEEKIRQEVEAMGISTVPSSPQSKQDDEEEVIPGTPKQQNEPTIVTPKDPPKQHIEEIIVNTEREVSNLTAPSAVMAGPNPEAPYETDESTVTSEIAEQVDHTLVASATRAMSLRSCKKTKSFQ
jgi:hypothetical protein